MMVEDKNSSMVSVIVPVYNCEKYLKRCLDSIIGQSYKNIEVVLVDDGSTDSSGGICDEYEKRDKRIEVVHVKNGGASAARNLGVDSSKGEYLFFADADDYLDKDAIKLLVENCRKTNADMVIGDFFIIDEARGVRETGFLFPEEKLMGEQSVVINVRSYLRKPTGYSPFVFPWGKLYRTAIIKENCVSFKVDMHVFEDILFNFMYLRFAGSVAYVRARIYSYMVYAHETAGAKVLETPLGFKASLESIGNFLESKGVEKSGIEREVGHAHVSFAIRVMIRLFVLKKFMDKVTTGAIYECISKIVNDKDIRRSLAFYTPSKGDSKVLPLLIKAKLVWVIMLVCKYKTR